jgi:TonB family protein
VVGQTESETRAALTARGVRSSPLLWAALFSMAVHSVLVAMPLARHGSSERNQDDRGARIEAMLVASNETATGVDVLVAPAPLEPIPDYTLPAALPSAVAVPPATAAAQARESGGMQGGVLVEAQPLQDTFRLGSELQARQMSDFPLELDSPVGLRQAIVARYPPAALAAGREGSVVAWVLVDARGDVEEIQIADGAEEFANAVSAAIRDAHFVPARINAAPIRFPISLEFRFSAVKPAASLPDAARPATAAQPN